MTLPHEAWSDLRRAQKGDGRLEIPSLASAVSTGYGAIRFALGGDAEPRLLVPCASVRARVPADPSQKLSLRVLEYQSSEGRQAYIDLMCRDRLLEMVFSELCSDVMRRVEIGQPPEIAVSGAIEDFRTLLSKDRQGEPSREEILGLIGELYLLHLLAASDTDAARFWLGPWDQRHDFRSSVRAIEVKTSGRSDASSVSIHGADQLLPPSRGALVLMQLRLEESAGAELAVGSLYSAVSGRLDNTKRLEEGLVLLGCEDPFAPSWNRYQFSFESMHAWKVEDGFPRITSREMQGGVMPPGIGRIEYSLDLSVVEDFRLSLDDFKIYMKNMCDENA